MFINSKHTCRFVEIVSGSREGAFWKKKPFFWKFCQNVGPTTTYSNAATNRKVWILIKLGLSSLVKYFNQFIINFDILGEMIMF